jgi:valyl-tRNA synthetase
LASVLLDLLKLLHPFMPYITEEIWSYFAADDKLIVASWPVENEELSRKYADDAAAVAFAIDVIRAVRNIRAESGAALSAKLPLILRVSGDSEASADVYAGYANAMQAYIEKIAGLSAFTLLGTDDQVPDECATALVAGAEVFVPLDDLLDYDAEREKLTKEVARLEGEIKRVQGMLANSDFTSKAPANVIDAQKTKLADAEDGLAKAKARLIEIADK